MIDRTHSVFYPIYLNYIGNFKNTQGVCGRQIIQVRPVLVCPLNKKITQGVYEHN